MGFFDRVMRAIAPRWSEKRARSRAVTTIVRHYEAASTGRRTANWNSNKADANTLILKDLVKLRGLARNLVRNNGFARRAHRVIANNVVGWGIVPRPIANDPAAVSEVWRQWAESTYCDMEGRTTFAGLQHAAMKTIVESGEVLIRRYPVNDPEAVLPLKIRVLEPDFLDTEKNEPTAGGRIMGGVETDKTGKRVAYWLFESHPGEGNAGQSKRVPAEDILHVFYSERPGQVRGVSWFAPAIVTFTDFDEFEDAQLMRQKIAACFAGVVTDLDGSAPSLGEQDDTDPLLETLEPGTISYLPPGKQVEFANPPLTTDDGFSNRQLRRIASAMGVTYEDLTGDYSQVNFSSARMSRISHWANVRDWQHNMLIPGLCEGVWGWFIEVGTILGHFSEVDPPRADWTTPPMPMIEPDREGLAYQRLVRNGVMTPSEVIREQGGDPGLHWEAYAADLQTLDALGIKLDCDVRAVSQAGLTQLRVGLSVPDPET